MLAAKNLTTMSTDTFGRLYEKACTKPSSITISTFCDSHIITRCLLCYAHRHRLLKPRFKLINTVSRLTITTTQTITFIFIIINNQNKWVIFCLLILPRRKCVKDSAHTATLLAFFLAKKCENEKDEFSIQ